MDKNISPYIGEIEIMIDHYNNGRMTGAELMAGIINSANNGLAHYVDGLEMKFKEKTGSFYSWE